MDFVKSLSMFHVDAKEIPCVTGNGAPTEKTEGAPGVLYMDEDTGVLYKCRAADHVNGAYTWEPVKEGGSSDGGQNVELDTTLTQSGKAADAKAVGDMIAQLSNFTLINQNGGGALKIWAGTQAEYDALLVKDESVVYLIDGSTTSGGGGSADTEETTYTIMKNLSNVTISNSASSVTAGSAYSATLTVATSYEISEVAVYMNGVDITATAYADGVISIVAVTGDVVISAAAVSISGGGGSDEPDMVLAMFDAGHVVSGPYTAGYIDDAGAVQPLTNGYFYDGLVSADGVALLDTGYQYIADHTIRVAEYDADEMFIERHYVAGEGRYFTDNEQVKYIKGGFTYSGDVNNVILAFVKKVDNDSFFTLPGDIDSTGNFVEGGSAYATPYIELSDGCEKIILAGKNTNRDYIKIAFYDSDKAFIERKYGAWVNAYDVPANAAYIRISRPQGFDCFAAVVTS